MTEVHTCTVVDPSAMTWAAYRQVARPPIPEMGMPTAGAAAQAATMLSAMGFTAGPQYPPWLPSPRTAGLGAKLSRSMDTIELMVLISEMASAPPALAARAT